MSTTITISFRKPFAVFPLSECVMLPHTLLPLHIFEPRYRAMVGEALDASGVIAMGLFARPVAKDEYAAGRPALRPYVCIGAITHYEPTEDGRYLLLLQGLCRARIVKEVPHEPYRRFLLEPGAPAEGRVPGTLRARILEALRHPALDGLVDLPPDDPAAAGVPGTALVDAVTAAVAHDTESRYAMLSEPDPAARGAWLLRALRRMRAGET
jgi:Lon protease-like protein